MPRDATAIVAEIEGALAGALARADAPRTFLDACRYALLGGGKRLRPLLAWRCAEAVGGLGEASLPAGVAVEMVHAFSLVHDDLPALDNDDLRRGRPTLHRHAGEATAILAGDALLTYAFEYLSEVPLEARPGGDGALGPLERLVAPATAMAVDEGREALAAPALRGALIGELAGATAKMIHGQAWDLGAPTPAGLSELERLRLIHSHKTGALIRVACRMGAMCGAGRPDAPGLDAITRFAETAGVMFQVVDDLIDATQPAAAAGKRTGKDTAMGKVTYPGLLGIEGTRGEVARLRGEALGALEVFGPGAESLRELTEQLAGRTS